MIRGILEFWHPRAENSIFHSTIRAILAGGVANWAWNSRSAAKRRVPKYRGVCALGGCILEVESGFGIQESNFVPDSGECTV